jgi:endonuclease/exonuclease/phosphatase family metal-dependent hydrolase
MTDKADETFRIIQLNVATMAETKNSAEFRSFTNKVEDTEADCVTCQELNRVWHRLPETDRLHERFRGTFAALHLCESRYSNDHFAMGSTQYGGTMVASINAAAHAIHSVGNRASDFTGLGRWSATRYAGKFGKALRVISALGTTGGTER